MTAIVGFVIGLACGAVLVWILLALGRGPIERRRMSEPPPAA